MLGATDLSQARIGQISITVHNLGRAVAFYSEKLGLKFLFTVSKLGFFDCGGIRLMLAVPESAESDHPSSVLYFSVDDIQTVFTSLSEGGVRFEGPPHLIAKMDSYDLWMAFFRDSENNLLSLMSNVVRSQ
ncbi:MAG: VOC family protein [Acidobacteria bacterium]|nr:VOC family protein [Acidobacteriota bacterium]